MVYDRSPLDYHFSVWACLLRKIPLKKIQSRRLPLFVLGKKIRGGGRKHDFPIKTLFSQQNSQVYIKFCAILFVFKFTLATLSFILVRESII